MKKTSKIDGRKYPWPHNPMIQPMKMAKPCLMIKAPKKPAAAFWGDPDKDGVINAFDCAPHNPRKQGPEHEELDKELKDIRTQKLSMKQARRDWKAMEGKKLKTDYYGNPIDED